MKMPFKTQIVPLSEVPAEEEFDVPADSPTVLVVDDEHLVADTLSLIFKRAGFAAKIAYNAEDALEIAKLNPPDILISDVDMPNVSGVDLALDLLKICPTCAVLLFSGHATAADLAKATEAGYDFPLLPKPVHPQVMLDSVSRRLGVPIPRALRPRSLPKLLPSFGLTASA